MARLPRPSPALKLVCLGVVLLALFSARSPWTTAGGLCLALALTAVARVPPRTLVAHIGPALWFLVPLTALQVWWTGWLETAVTLGTLLAALMLATLLTLTTRTQELLDTFVAALRPLRPLGIDPERVALVFSLTLRSIPVVAVLARQVQEARKARGAERSVRAFAVPLVVRTVRHADRLGEALQARGVDD